MLRLRISAENLSAFKREAELIFNSSFELSESSILSEKKFSQQKIISACEKSAGIKKAYVDEYCIWERKSGQYLDRMPKAKPAFHPTALKPKLARLLVNLSQAKSQLVDPFCGTGSIVLESAILRIPAIGIDLDPKAAQMARSNLLFYSGTYNLAEGLDWKIIRGDATNLSEIFPKKIEAIATDPPYGISSTLAGRKIKDLYESFIKEAVCSLKKGKKLIFVRPKTLKLSLSKYDVLNEFDFYMHKSLTRVVTEIRA